MDAGFGVGRVCRRRAAMRVSCQVGSMLEEDAWRARRDEAGSLVFEHAVTGALQPSLPSEFDSWIEASDNALPSSVPFNPASSWRVAFTGPNRRGDMFFVQSSSDGDGPLKTRRDVPTEGCSGYAPS